MIEEAVAAVKKTEGQADELLRQAGQDSAEILKEAKAEAEELKAKAGGSEATGCGQDGAGEG